MHGNVHCETFIHLATRHRFVPPGISKADTQTRRSRGSCCRHSDGECVIQYLSIRGLGFSQRGYFLGRCRIEDTVAVPIGIDDLSAVTQVIVILCSYSFQAERFSNLHNNGSRYAHIAVNTMCGGTVFKVLQAMCSGDCRKPTFLYCCIAFLIVEHH